MAGCGLLASMHLACSGSYSFNPRARLVKTPLLSNSGVRCGGRGVSGRGCRRSVPCGGSGFESRLLRSWAPTTRWNSRGFLQLRAAGGSSNDRRKKGPSSKDGPGKGSPEKKVDRKQRDNVWSSEEPQRSAKSSAKKGSEGNKGGSNKNGKGGSRPRASESSKKPPVPAEKKISHEEEDLEFLKYLSPPLPIESETVLHPEESFANPLWSTFCSSTSGVWRGVGAAFSPITAELEALYLNKQKEYLYDARILNTVEVVRKTQDGEQLPLENHYLNRRVLWSLENPLGEKGLGRVRVAEDAEEENARLSSFFGKGTPYIGGTSHSVDDGDDDDLGYWDEEEETEDDGEEAVEYDAEWESIVGTAEDIDTRWINGKPDNLDVMPELKVDVGTIREDGKEWRAMWNRGEVLEGDWERLASPAGEMENGINGSKYSSEAYAAPLLPPNPAGPTYAPEHLTDALGTTWADVMEEDVMEQEEGLVYFEDGSYSKGPLELLTEASTSGREYFNAYTCKIEQCLVAGGHKRLRIVHTVSVESEGEQVEVLRVAVYEEEWMGPCNMKSISDAGGQQLKLFSDRPRHSPLELVGSWKVFEKEAMAYHPAKDSSEKPSFVHSCREIAVTRGEPEMPEESPDYSPETDDEPVDMSEFSMLWLTGGVSTYVEVNETGMLTFGVGWLSGNGSRLVMERVYSEDGKLLHVKSKTEIEASLGVPM
ncbi:hypothetical protein MPTK1_3g21680 [Marchantia polymorpha subsp. ruderalis]|uniref:DUF3598 domain-containing protein n=2 Tax=Marchantia polymorpha TaxID=3197 RepID=A0AAF6B3B5_MARPO|nr:hypothetical protein MARPO_0089s0048 [Marchantia polymorpha]BBN06499.1 hypothetical protein Mp_3g21680 [Marchantia polymorpha subsp. ruderalis]|eukprot:PTQ33420.1 hypothetical protein MARPO_0089s0048 [Marchantia polymorpha]